ncbi:hypothetical protein IMZ38_01845 [Thermosphaera chiliense]|uniref:Transcription elongation factor n=1 Tax=Thermosphaera chiliense TaxID=3402707 RepID=A0A7M1UR88_9CREN|nr:hypothetical protein [Thermosphaera aggregans]QOR94701.1 hypothetical protein IMZ38_01845 [Thermosphaera aggregans]
MGRRKKRRKIQKRIVRIPSVFQCPNCGSVSLSVEFSKAEEAGFKIAKISCGRCGLRAEYPNPVPDLYQAVDVYNKFIDLFEEGKVQVTFEKPKTEEGGAEEAGGVEEGS